MECCLPTPPVLHCVGYTKPHLCVLVLPSHVHAADPSIVVNHASLYHRAVQTLCCSTSQTTTEVCCLRFKGTRQAAWSQISYRLFMVPNLCSHCHRAVLTCYVSLAQTCTETCPLRAMDNTMLPDHICHTDSCDRIHSPAKLAPGMSGSGKTC